MCVLSKSSSSWAACFPYISVCILYIILFQTWNIAQNMRFNRWGIRQAFEMSADEIKHYDDENLNILKQSTKGNNKSYLNIFNFNYFFFVIRHLVEGKSRQPTTEEPCSSRCSIKLAYFDNINLGSPARSPHRIIFARNTAHLKASFHLFYLTDNIQGRCFNKAYGRIFYYVLVHLFWTIFIYTLGQKELWKKE